MKFDNSIVEPGDLCLYFPGSLFGWLIAIKTWTKISHCEIYEGAGMSVASRDGLGVNRYAFRNDRICEVRRPVTPISIPDANIWFNKVRGQKYDWKGILVFTLAVKQGAQDRQFCSEFATRWYRMAGLNPFAPEIDADHVSPSMLAQSIAFTTIWRLDAKD